MSNNKGFNLIIILVLLSVGIVIGVVATTVLDNNPKTPTIADTKTSDDKAIVNDNTPDNNNAEEQIEKIAEEDSKEDGFLKNIFTSSSDKLDLSNQGLTQVSQDVFKKTNLQELDVSNNNLTGALPGEIRHLQKLEVLNASNNQMTGVPAEIGQLSNLRILDLSNNQLTGLPYELGSLKNLEVLNLSGNNYSKYDMDIIRPGLPDDVQIID